MKKIIAICVMCCFFGGVADAEVSKRVDSFDGTVKIYSIRQNVGELNGQFNFIKIIPLKSCDNFQIFISTEVLKMYNFSKDRAEIKIDDNIHNMNVVFNRDYKDTRGGIYDIATTIQFSSDVIESLKSAKKVTLRLHRENGYQDIVEVPDHVLTEWKQVIAMEK